MLSMVACAGDGVVTEDEFTAWAKEQALRVQVWERRLEDVMSDLDEQVEKAVDQDALSARLVIFVTPVYVICFRMQSRCDLSALAVFIS